MGNPDLSLWRHHLLRNHPLPLNDDAPWPISPTPTTRIVSGLFRSRNYVWENDHKIAATFGVTWTQFLTLYALRSAGPDFRMSPTELYAATQASSGGITKMLHALEAGGHVARVSCPSDRRSRLVQLTEPGAALVEAIVEKLIEVNTELFSGILSESDCEALADLLGKMTAGLEEKLSPKGPRD